MLFPVYYSLDYISTAKRICTSNKKIKGVGWGNIMDVLKTTSARGSAQCALSAHGEAAAHGLPEWQRQQPAQLHWLHWLQCGRLWQQPSALLQS